MHVLICRCNGTACTNALMAAHAFRQVACTLKGMQQLSANRIHYRAPRSHLRGHQLPAPLSPHKRVLSPIHQLPYLLPNRSVQKAIPHPAVPQLSTRPSCYTSICFTVPSMYLDNHAAGSIETHQYFPTPSGYRPSSNSPADSLSSVLHTIRERPLQPSGHTRRN
jgi:hypothetical protein